MASNREDESARIRREAGQRRNEREREDKGGETRIVKIKREEERGRVRFDKRALRSERELEEWGREGRDR